MSGVLVDPLPTSKERSIRDDDTLTFGFNGDERSQDLYEMYLADRICINEHEERLGC
jgi:hypothetical protein